MVGPHQACPGRGKQCRFSQCWRTDAPCVLSAEGWPAQVHASQVKDLGQQGGFRDHQVWTASQRLSQAGTKLMSSERTSSLQAGLEGGVGREERGEGREAGRGRRSSFLDVVFSLLLSSHPETVAVFLV